MEGQNHVVLSKGEIEAADTTTEYHNIKVEVEDMVTENGVSESTVCFSVPMDKAPQTQSGVFSGSDPALFHTKTEVVEEFSTLFNSSSNDCTSLEVMQSSVKLEAVENREMDHVEKGTVENTTNDSSNLEERTICDNEETGEELFNLLLEEGFQCIDEGTELTENTSNNMQEQFPTFSKVSNDLLNRQTTQEIDDTTNETSSRANNPENNEKSSTSDLVTGTRILIEETSTSVHLSVQSGNSSPDQSDLISDEFVILDSINYESDEDKEEITVVQTESVKRQSESTIIEPQTESIKQKFESNKKYRREYIEKLLQKSEKQRIADALNRRSTTKVKLIDKPVASKSRPGRNEHRKSRNRLTQSIGNEPPTSNQKVPVTTPVLSELGKNIHAQPLEGQLSTTINEHRRRNSLLQSVLEQNPNTIGNVPPILNQNVSTAAMPVLPESEKNVKPPYIQTSILQLPDAHAPPRQLSAKAIARNKRRERNRLLQRSISNVYSEQCEKTVGKVPPISHQGMFDTCNVTMPLLSQTSIVQPCNRHEPPRQLANENSQCQKTIGNVDVISNSPIGNVSNMLPELSNLEELNQTSIMQTSIADDRSEITDNTQVGQVENSLNIKEEFIEMDSLDLIKQENDNDLENETSIINEEINVEGHENEEENNVQQEYIKKKRWRPSREHKRRKSRKRPSKQMRAKLKERELLKVALTPNNYGQPTQTSIVESSIANDESKQFLQTVQTENIPLISNNTLLQSVEIAGNDLNQPQQDENIQTVVSSVGNEAFDNSNLLHETLSRQILQTSAQHQGEIISLLSKLTARTILMNRQLERNILLQSIGFDNSRQQNQPDEDQEANSEGSMCNALEVLQSENTENGNIHKENTPIVQAIIPQENINALENCQKHSDEVQTNQIGNSPLIKNIKEECIEMEDGPLEEPSIPDMVVVKQESHNGNEENSNVEKVKKKRNRPRPGRGRQQRRYQRRRELMKLKKQLKKIDLHGVNLQLINKIFGIPKPESKMNVQTKNIKEQMETNLESFHENITEPEAFSDQTQHLETTSQSSGDSTSISTMDAIPGYSKDYDGNSQLNETPASQENEDSNNEMDIKLRICENDELEENGCNSEMLLSCSIDKSNPGDTQILVNNPVGDATLKVNTGNEQVLETLLTNPIIPLESQKSESGTPENTNIIHQDTEQGESFSSKNQNHCKFVITNVESVQEETNEVVTSEAVIQNIKQEKVEIEANKEQKSNKEIIATNSDQPSGFTITNVETVQQDQNETNTSIPKFVISNVETVTEPSHNIKETCSRKAQGKTVQTKPKTSKKIGIKRKRDCDESTLLQRLEEGRKMEKELVKEINKGIMFHKRIDRLSRDHNIPHHQARAILNSQEVKMYQKLLITNEKGFKVNNKKPNSNLPQIKTENNQQSANKNTKIKKNHLEHIRNNTPHHQAHAILNSKEVIKNNKQFIQNSCNEEGSKANNKKPGSNFPQIKTKNNQQSANKTTKIQNNHLEHIRNNTPHYQARAIHNSKQALKNQKQFIKNSFNKSDTCNADGSTVSKKKPNSNWPQIKTKHNQQNTNKTREIQINPYEDIRENTDNFPRAKSFQKKKQTLLTSESNIIQLTSNTKVRKPNKMRKDRLSNSALDHVSMLAETSNPERRTSRWGETSRQLPAIQRNQSNFNMLNPTTPHQGWGNSSQITPTGPIQQFPTVNPTTPFPMWTETPMSIHSTEVKQQSFHTFNLAPVPQPRVPNQQNFNTFNFPPAHQPLQQNINTFNMVPPYQQPPRHLVPTEANQQNFHAFNMAPPPQISNSIMTPPSAINIQPSIPSAWYTASAALSGQAPVVTNIFQASNTYSSVNYATNVQYPQNQNTPQVYVPPNVFPGGFLNNNLNQNPIHLQPNTGILQTGPANSNTQKASNVSEPSTSGEIYSDFDIIPEVPKSAPKNTSNIPKDDSDNFCARDIVYTKDIFLNHSVRQLKTFLREEFDKMDKLKHKKPNALYKQYCKLSDIAFKNRGIVDNDVRLQLLNIFHILNMYIFGVHKRLAGAGHYLDLQRFLRCDTVSLPKVIRENLLKSYMYLFGSEQHCNIDYKKQLKGIEADYTRPFIKYKK